MTPSGSRRRPRECPVNCTNSHVNDDEDEDVEEEGAARAGPPLPPPSGLRCCCCCCRGAPLPSSSPPRFTLRRYVADTNEPGLRMAAAMAERAAGSSAG